jgi:Cu(I)/Ag(I) efflux system membrane fusion protein
MKSLGQLAAFLLGLVLGGALLFAHFMGHLTPIYHYLGLHSLAGAHETPSTAGAMPMGHAGHGGMSMSHGEQSGKPSGIPGRAIVSITPERRQLIGVRTGKVVHGPLVMSVRAVGIIEPDQALLYRSQTRVSGWITKVYVYYVGQTVKKGDPLLEIYSPDLLATQEEYLIALESGNKGLVKSALRRLELWDVPADELKQLEKTKKPRDTLLLRSPINGQVLQRKALEGTRVEPQTELYRITDLSVVWLQAKIYEYELPHIEVGQRVRVSLLSRSAKPLEGKVAFIEPVVQEITRTVNVRVELKNPKGELRPGMYADMSFTHDMGEGLLVPESAVLRTGERNLAFRVLGEGTFEPVEVKIGGRFGEQFEVLSGLSAGHEVATSAVFLIDSESRLKSALAGFGPHQHGSGSAPPKAAPAPEKRHDHSHHGHDQP